MIQNIPVPKGIIWR